MKVTNYGHAILLLMVIFLTACATSLPIMDRNIKYQRDLSFEVEYWDLKKKQWFGKRKFVGVAVLKAAPKYRVTLYAVGKVDMMVLSSCHREVKTPNPKKHGGWFSKKYYEFEFTADDMIERGKPCMLNGSIYEKKKGRHGWLMAAIEDPKAKLQAKTRCNGKIEMNGGTSFCQAKEGLIQRIEFDRPVSTTFYGNCKIEKPKDQMNWEYLMPSGKCILHFIDENENEHVAYMYGYGKIPIRGVE